MKKVLIVVLAVMLAVGALAVMGCGDDTGLAKDHMEDADKEWTRVNKKLDELTAQSDKLIAAAMMGDTAVLEAGAEALAEMPRSMAVYTTELETAKLSYQKILELKGVEDYKEYANAMVKVIDAQKASITAGAELLEKLAPILATGDMAKLSEALQEGAEDIAKIQELQKASDKAQTEAHQIKEDKKLGE